MQPTVIYWSNATAGLDALLNFHYHKPYVIDWQTAMWDGKMRKHVRFCRNNSFAMPIQGPNQTNDMHWLDYTYTGLVM